ncbi:flavodoxin family protein [Pseudodesulfovibrio sp. zrk46]|uniref:flavodoxin family protein n=1 Tax=Pseudodesulfovibrio sp. zrk46 TaxID=2725288 RepID=UPI001448AECA|nr:flavodoxin family protein [Pseudodesulfovibrio sp. zrk46]QJB57118.1 flavodoxin family protein [Pseudodesulfovibrio sp. zrk46]
MKVIAVNGSPRKGGNTDNMLKHALDHMEKAGWETEFVQLGGRNIRGCMACGKCWENKDFKCIVNNDIFNEIMEKMLEADAIILGSPTYFSDVSAELKALLDRSGMVALANDRAFAGKIGTAVVAVRRGGGIHVFDTINHMYLMSQMIVPGATYWNLGRGLDKGEVLDDPEGLDNMKTMAETIDWLGRAMKPHQGTFPKNNDFFG